MGSTTPEQRRARTTPGLIAIGARYRRIVDPHGRLSDDVAADLIRELRAAQLAENRARATTTTTTESENPS